MAHAFNHGFGHPMGASGRASGPVARHAAPGRDHAPIIATGQAVGEGEAAGRAHFVASIEDLRTLAPGDVLLAETTRPEWEEAMTTAGAIVTNQGGPTSHAALTARRLRIPAVIGTVDGASRVWTGARLVVSCAGGDLGLVCEIS